MNSKIFSCENKNAYIILNFWAGHTAENFPQIIKQIRTAADKVNLTINLFPEHALIDLFEDDYTWEPIEKQYQRSKGCDLLVVVGGDGTKTHVLNRLIQENQILPVVGIGTGTMNVGKINAFRYGVDKIDFSNVREHKINAVKIDKSDSEKSYAFFDAIIGTTCITTIDGAVTQVSAERIAHGEKEVSNPQFIGDDSTIVELHRENGEAYELQSPNQIGIIAVSPLPESLKAQTLAGGADPSACLEFPGGLIVSDFPLVWASVSKEELKQLPQIISHFTPLEYGDVVVVRNLVGNPYLVSDGNSDGKLNTCGTSCKFSLLEDVFTILG